MYFWSKLGIDFDIGSELAHRFGVKQVGIFHTVYEIRFVVSENECFSIRFKIGLENFKNTNILLNFSHLLDLCFEGN